MAGSATADSSSKRRFNRGDWLIIGGILAFTLFQLLAFLFKVAQPTDGCFGQTIRTCIGEWETPLRPGDEILTVAGRSVEPDLIEKVPPAPPEWVSGADIPYVVRRDGVELTLQVPLRTMGLTEVARFFALDWESTLISIFSLLIAVWAFRLRPGIPATRLLLISQASSAVTQFFAIGSAGLLSLEVWGIWPSPLADVAGGILALSFGWLSIPALLLLMLSFPIPVWPVSRRPKLSTALIFGVALVMAIAASITGSFLIFLAQLGLYAGLVLLTFLGTTVYIGLRIHDPRIRAQAAWMRLGFAAFSTSPILWVNSLIFPDFGAWLAARGWLNDAFGLVSTLALPLCLGIAITRYRLFDIDVIIRRTLAYTVLTLSLAAIYFIGVVALQALFVRLTGAESTLAVVASTLAIAALFQPLRRRVQTIIDRRFFRRKYDAQQVLEQFARRAQQEEELDAISADLVRTVREALEPVGVTLWLRKRP